RVYARAGERLYALNTPDGSIAWVFDADADLNVGAILVPGGRILLADAAGALYLLDASLDYAASAWPVAEYGNRRHSGKTGDVLPLTITTIKILQPDGVDDVAEAAYTIAWTDGDPDDNASISFYYDTDDGGADGVLIAENINEDDETDRYEWDVSEVPEGDYYIYAIINDGGDPVVDYSDGVVTIQRPSIPSLPPDALHVGYPSAQAGAPDPADFTCSTPFFSAINRCGEAATAVQIQLTLAGDAGFDAPIWNSGDIPINALGDGGASTAADGERTPDVFYGMGAAPSAILEHGRAYTWRIRIKAGENYSDWSANGAIAMRDEGDLTARFYSVKDTYYGTVYWKDGRPEDESIEIGGWADWYYGYFGWDLTLAPLAQTVVRAEMNLYGEGNRVNDPEIKIRRVTSPWEEAGVSNADHPSETDVGEVAMAHPAPDRYNTADITDFFIGWQNGSYDNHGLKLHPTRNSGGTQLRVYSKEQPGINKDPYLEVVYKDDSPWLTSVVDATGKGCKGVSIALDRDGRPGVSYELTDAASTRAVNHARKDARTWSIETVKVLKNTTYGTSLKYDSESRPRLTFRDYRDNKNYYAEKNGDAWRLHYFSGLPVDGDLEIDDSDVVHIAWYLGSKLEYRRWDGSAWQHATVDASGDVGYGAELALDAAGRKYISYAQWGHALKFAHFDGARWSVEFIDNSVLSANLSHPIGLDDQQTPFVLYVDSDQSVLLASRINGQWRFEPTPLTYPVGSHVGFIIDGSNRIHISCIQVDGEVYYVQYFLYDGESWSNEVVDRFENPVTQRIETDLTLFSDGTVHIAYTDPVNNHIKYAIRARQAPPTCNLEITGASGGSVTKPGEGAFTYPCGEVVDLEAAPIACHKFVNWTGDVADSDSATTTVTMDADKSVTANFSPEIAVSFSSETYNADEDSGVAEISAALSAACMAPITVDYAATDGTATAGEDYTATSGTLTFAPGETEKAFTVSILDDGVVEMDETIMLALSNPSGGLLGAPNAAVLSITHSNTPPAAAEDEYSVDEGGVLVAPTPGVLGNDSDPENDDLTAAPVDDASHGDLSLNPDGSFVYQHDGGETAGDAFTYKASDGTADSAPAQVRIAVRGVNDPPETMGDAHAVDEGGVIVQGAPGILANDTDPENDSLTAILVADASHGALSLNPDGSFTYQHDGGETAGDSFTYKAGDGALEGAPAAVSITIHPVNDPPKSVGLGYTIDAGGFLAKAAPGVLANDSDPENHPLEAILVADASHGELTLNADGSFTYQHDGSDAPRDAFTYKANDGDLDGPPAEIAFTMLPPEATISFSSNAFTIPESAGGAEITATLSAPGSETVTVDYSTADGTATAGEDYTAAAGTLTFAPGETVRTFTTPVLADALDEPDETIRLTLSNPVHAAPGEWTEAVLTILDNKAPALVWKKTNGVYLKSRPALGDDGFLYTKAGPTASHENSGITAIDPSDGSVVWGPMIPPGCDSGGRTFGGVATVGANHVIYGVGDWNACRDGRLVGFNHADGAIVWDHGTSGAGYSPHPRQAPAIDDALGAVYFGTNSLFSVDMNSGSDNWVKSGGYYIGARGMAIDSESNIYYGTHNGSPSSVKIRSFTSDGALRWEQTFPPASIHIKAMLPGDVLMLVNYNEKWMKAHDKDGNVLWSVDNLTKPAVDEAGNIYASNIAGPDVVSLGADGAERWRRSLPGAERVHLDFIDASGRVYARAGERLYALNTPDGSIAWVFDADADLNVGAILVPGGRILLAD
ncbi:MAG: tandem-95 repeat protein, partial [Desulfobacterales bacterium]|nr:tandem-95 repeat protein [Desulfobacterales bacterium]